MGMPIQRNRNTELTMSLINNSALSFIATAVGCTLTGIAVNEHLDQPNQTGPIKLGIQQNPLMDAEDLMVAASDGVEQSVAPPGQMFTQDLTPSVQADDFSNFRPKEPEIWQQSPLDIGNLVVKARPLPRIEQPTVKPTGNFSNEYFPDYLNFDGDAQAPEPIEMATEKLPQPGIINEPMAVSAFPSALEPVPAPPPLFNDEPIGGEYIVEPETMISNGFEGVYPDNITSQEQLSNRSSTNATQYIVEPQSMTRATPQPQQVRENSQASMPEFYIADSAKLAAQYVVEPRTVMAVFPSEQSPEILSTSEVNRQRDGEVTHSRSQNPRVSRTSRSNPSQTTVASTVNSSVSATNPKPKLLQKLVEPDQLPSEIGADDIVYSVTSTPKNNQMNSEIAANSVEEETEVIVAVESELDTVSESMMEEPKTEIEQMPSLLRKLVESYNVSSDVLHDIKVSPSPLKAFESKFAQNQL